MYPHILWKKPDHAVCLWCFVGSSPQSLECQRQSECVQNVMRFVPELSLLISHHFKDTKRSDRDLFLSTCLHLNRNTYGRIIHKKQKSLQFQKASPSHRKCWKLLTQVRQPRPLQCHMRERISGACTKSIKLLRQCINAFTLRCLLHSEM